MAQNFNYSGYVNRYLNALQPSIERETNRADAQMASRGLYRSTAGAGYADAKRNDLIGQATREALNTAEGARKTDLENRRSQERNVSEALNTQYGYTLGQRELSENPKMNVKVSPALQKILDRYYRNMGDAKETWGGGEGGDWLAVKGTDNRGARLNRELDMQEQDLLAKQRIAAASNALQRRSMQADQDALAWERDPKNILLGMMRDSMAGGTQYDPETGEPIPTVAPEAWAGMYQSVLGRDLYGDYQQGDEFARGFLAFLNNPAFAEGIQTRIPGLTPTMRAEQASAANPQQGFWSRLFSPAGRVEDRPLPAFLPKMPAGSSVPDTDRNRKLWSYADSIGR